MSAGCLVADDHPALVRAICDTVEAQGYSVLGPATDGLRAVDLATQQTPLLAVVDLRMPRLAGVPLVERLREASPEMRIVVFTGEVEAGIAAELLDRGAAGIVLKDAPIADLQRALGTVASGGRYVDAAVAAALAVEPRLSPRETEVLCGLARGRTMEQLADDLGISAGTVRAHAVSARTRLGMPTKTAAVAYAIRRGLIA
ncbi:MAG: response regulator transcription factor [Actinobacteria bacterium]|nr:response regulator transcription factor [Actinomycetota bacterium]